MKKNILSIIMASVPIIMLTIPLPNPVLYVLFRIDVSSVITFGIIVFIGNLKRKNLQFIPRYLLVWVLFNIVFVISLTRNIITTESFENQNKISSLIFAKNTSIANIIIVIAIFLCLTITGFILKNIVRNRLKRQWKSAKNEGNNEKIEFYKNLEGAFRFLNGAFIFVLFITIVIFLCGSLLGNLRYGKPMIECIKENVLLAMGTSIVLQALNICCNFIVSNCLK